LQQLQDAVAMMREIRVQPHVAAVSTFVGAGDLVPQLRRGTAVDREIALAARGDRRGAHIDANLLPASGAGVPDFRRRKRGYGDAHLHRRADRKRRWQDRLAAGRVQMFERSGIVTMLAPERRQARPCIDRSGRH
jgi:hypothetical protein